MSHITIFQNCMSQRPETTCVFKLILRVEGMLVLKKTIRCTCRRNAQPRPLSYKKQQLKTGLLYLYSYQRVHSVISWWTGRVCSRNYNTAIFVHVSQSQSYSEAIIKHSKEILQCTFSNKLVSSMTPAQYE